MRRASFNALIVTCALLMATLALACSRSPEDLEVWRPSKAANGLDKLTEWIADPDVPMDVRIRASEILIEEDYAYAVGSALEKSSEEDRKAIVEGAAPRVLEWYKAGDATVDNYQAGKSKQVLGKDGAYHLYRYAEGTNQHDALEGALVDWLGEDYFVRDQMGTVKINQIAEAVGPKAADPLLKALTVQENNQKFIADLLRKIKDPKLAKKRAEALASMVDKQIPKIDQDLEVAFIEETHEAITPTLVKLVNNENVDGTLRTNAHAKIGEINGIKAMPIYLEWVKKGPDLLRWISVQALGETMSKPAFAAILKALPEKGDYGKDEPEKGFATDAGRFCMVEVKEMVTTKKIPLEGVFVDALKSGTTPAKAVALRCLQEESVGSKKARPAVEALEDDKTELPAFGDTKTLGDLASETLKKLPK